MDTHEKDRNELRTIQAVFEQAVKNNSIEDLRPHVDSEFSFVSFTDSEFDSFDSFKQQWNLTRKNMIGSGCFSTQLNPTPTLFIDNVAICHGNSQNKMVDNKGITYNFTSHWSVIFRRNDEDEWKVLRAHNSLNPFSNPMLKQGVKMTIIKSSLLAFMLGVVLCIILSYLLST